MTPRLLAAALLSLVLAGCAGATYDEAYGRPDATRWSYFEATAERVVQHLEAYYDGSEVVLESSQDLDGGVVLTFASRRGGANVLQILVQRTAVGAFQSRAQQYPRRRPLARSMERFVEGRS